MQTSFQLRRKWYMIGQSFSIVCFGPSETARWIMIVSKV